MKTLSERLIETRRSNGISQQELAKRVRCSQSLIGNLEAGRQKSSTKIPQIAAALGVTAIWLSQGKGVKAFASQGVLQEGDESQIDALFLSRCLTAIDQSLAAQNRSATQDYRIARTCDLYSLSHGHNKTAEMTSTFIERLAALVITSA